MQNEAVWVGDRLFIDPPEAEGHPLYDLLAAGIAARIDCTPAEAEACARAFLTQLKRDRYQAYKDDYIVLRLIEHYPPPPRQVQEWIAAMIAQCRRELAELADLTEGGRNGL